VDIGRIENIRAGTTEAIALQPLPVICSALNAVTHPSTYHAQRCLTMMTGREPTFPNWHGRWRSTR